MRVSHKNKWIFLAMPKTGSASIRSALDEFSDLKSVHITKRKKTQNPFYDHINLREVVSLFKNKNWDFESYYTFATIRNPWDRTVSLYYHARQHSWTKANFKKWLYKIKENGGFYESIYGKCSNKEGTYCLDYILKFENLQEDFNTVCDKIGIPRQELPHRNKSEHKDYTKYYDDETRQIVAKKYARDIKHFGYKFGE